MTAVAGDPPILALERITAGYGETTVLRDVSLAVAPGAVVALLGPNGAGKTTLLRAASGLLRPTAGSVEIGGTDVTRRSASRRARSGMCLIPEGRGIFRSLTVLENLALQVPPWKKDGDVERAFEAFPVLANRRRQVAGSMSGGEQQMLALARCYLADPRVVLLDEVSMGLAPRIIDEIFVSLRQLASEGVALLLVEQYVSRAMEIADTVYLLDRGTVGFSGPPSALDESELTRRYFGADIQPPRVNNGRGPSVTRPQEVKGND